MNFKQIDYIQNDCATILEGQVEKLESLKNKSIFITGASGFVGKWVIELINFLNEKHSFNTEVHAFARTMKDTAEQHPNVFDKSWIRLIDGEIQSLSEIDINVSYVLHLAGSPDNRFHASNPVKMMNDITSGTGKVLEQCVRLENLEKFVFFSSGHVYGGLPFSEDCLREDSFYGLNCSSLTSFYAEAKRVAESMTQAYRSQYRIPVTIFRPFAFAGPYQLLDRPWAINNFLRDGLLGQSIRILGDEDTVRSYMYPSEMALWTLLGMTENSSHAVYNLGGSEGRSLRSVAQTVEKSFATNAGVSTNVPLNNLHKSKFVPSVSRFEESFGLKQKIGTEEAIQKTIEWHLLGK